MTEPWPTDPAPAGGTRRSNRARTTPPRQRRPPPPPPPPNQYADAREFFTEALAVWYARQIGEHRWCDHAWDHSEVRARVTALHLAYEDLNAQGGEGPARWWVMYVDPMMGKLMDPQGTFVFCDHESHQVPPTLPG